MSHIRYCIGTYLHDKIRICHTCPKSKEIKDLQSLQNKMLRIILGISVRDHVSTEVMLKKTGMLSINQIACHSILMETWKAMVLGIESISGHFKLRNSIRFPDELQGNTDPKSFVSHASKLYNKSSKKFKQTSLTKVARLEAFDIVRSLPT